MHTTGGHVREGAPYNYNPNAAKGQPKTDGGNHTQAGGGYRGAAGQAYNTNRGTGGRHHQATAGQQGGGGGHGASQGQAQAYQGNQANSAYGHHSQPDSSAVVLVTGGFDHCIKFWDAQHGTCIRTIPFAESHINRLCISPDKRFVVAVGSQNAKVFEVAGMNQNPCLLIENHKPGGNIMVAEFQREMKWIVLASEDGVIRIHDFPKTNNLRRTIENKSAINDLKIHPEQDMLITIDQKGFLKLINLRDNSIECQVQPEEGVPLRSVAVARDCSLLVVTNNKGRCFLYHWPEPRQRSRLELLTQIDAHTKYAIRCCLSRNLQYLATCSADTSAKIWKLDGPNVELVHVLMGHEGWVWDLAFSDDSEYLVTAASDQKLRVWKVSSGELSRTIEGHNKAIMSVALNDSVAMRK